QIVVGGSTTSEPLPETTISIAESSTEIPGIGLFTKIPVTTTGEIKETVETAATQRTIIPVVITKENENAAQTTEKNNDISTTIANLIIEKNDETTILPVVASDVTTNSDDKTTKFIAEAEVTEIPTETSSGVIARIIAHGSTVEPIVQETKLVTEILPTTISEIKVEETTIETQTFSTNLPKEIVVIPMSERIATSTDGGLQTTKSFAQNIDETTAENIQPSESTTIEAATISIAPLESAQSVAPIAPLGEGQILVGGITTVEPVPKTTTLQFEKVTSDGLPGTTLMTQNEATIIPVIVASFTNEGKVEEATTSAPTLQNNDATTIVAEIVPSSESTIIETATISIAPLENAQSEAPVGPLGEGQILIGGSTTSEPLEETPATIVQATELTTTVEVVTEISPVMSSTVAPSTDENIPVVIVGHQDTAQSTSIVSNEELSTSTSKIQVTTVVPNTDATTKIVLLEGITDAPVNIAVTGIPVETSTGIVAGIIERGSTVEPVDEVTQIITEDSRAVTSAAPVIVETSTIVELPFTTKQDSIAAIIPIEEGKTNAPETTINPSTAQNIDATTIIAQPSTFNVGDVTTITSTGETIQPSEATTIEIATMSVVNLENAQSAAPIAPLGEGQVISGGSTTVESASDSTIAVTAGIVTQIRIITVKDNEETTEAPSTVKQNIIPVVVPIDEGKTNAPETIINPSTAQNVDATTIASESIQPSESTTIETATISIAPLENAQSVAPIASLGEGQIVVGGSTTSEPLPETTVLLDENVSTIESDIVTEVPLTTMITEKATIVPIIVANEEKIGEATTSAPTLQNNDATTIFAEIVPSSGSTTIETATISIASLENAQSEAPIAPLGEGQIVVGGSTTSEPLQETTILKAEEHATSNAVTDVSATTILTEKATILPVIIPNEEKVVETTNVPLNAENLDATTIIAETSQVTEKSQIVVEEIQSTIGVTEIPVVTSTGIIAEIIAHGSTVGSITEKVDIVVADSSPTTSVPSTVIPETSTVQSKEETIVPVIIQGKENINEMTTIISPITVIAEENVATSTVRNLNAQNVESSTIVAETILPIESASTIAIAVTEIPITTTKGGEETTTISEASTEQPSTVKQNIVPVVVPIEEGKTNAPETTIIADVQTTINPSSTVQPVVIETATEIPIVVAEMQSTVSVTEIPIETSTGIIAGIVAHGSTLEPIITDIPQTTVSAETAATSVINNEFVPVVIIKDEKSTASPLTTNIVEDLIVTSTATILNAENIDATTTIAETIQPSEATTSKQDNIAVIIPIEGKTIAPETTVIASEQTTINPSTAQNIGDTTIIAEKIQPSEATTIETATISIAPLESAQSVAKNAPLGKGQIVVGGSTTSEPLPETTVLFDENVSTIESDVVTEVPVTTVITEKATIVPIIISNKGKVEESTTNILSTTIPTIAQNADATTIIAETIQPLAATSVETVQSVVSLDTSTTAEPLLETTVGSTLIPIVNVQDNLATSVVLQTTEVPIIAVKQSEETTESIDITTQASVQESTGAIVGIIAHGSTVEPIKEETTDKMVTEISQIVTTADTINVETSTTNDEASSTTNLKIIPVVVSDNKKANEETTVIPLTTVLKEESVSSTISVINAENVDVTVAETIQPSEATTIESATILVANLENAQSAAPIAPLGEEQFISGGSTTVEPKAKTTILQSEKVTSGIVTEVPVTTVLAEKEATIIPVIIPNEEKIVEATTSAPTLQNNGATTIVAEIVPSSESTTIETATISIAPLENSQSVAPIAPLSEGQIVVGGSLTVEPKDEITTIHSEVLSIVTEIPVTTIKAGEEITEIVEASTEQLPTVKQNIIPVIIPIEEGKTNAPETTINPSTAQNLDATTIIAETIQPSEAIIAEATTIVSLESDQSVASIAPLGEDQIIVGGSTTVEPKVESIVVESASTIPSLSEGVTEIPVTTVKIHEETTINARQETIVPVVLINAEAAKSTQTTLIPENVSTATPVAIIVSEGATTAAAETTMIISEPNVTQNPIVTSAGIIAEIIAHGKTSQPSEAATIETATISIAPLGEGQIVVGGSTTIQAGSETTVIHAESVSTKASEVVTEVPVTTVMTEKEATIIPVIVANEGKIVETTTNIAEAQTTINPITAHNFDVTTTVSETIVPVIIPNEEKIIEVPTEGLPTTANVVVVSSTAPTGETAQPSEYTTIEGATISIAPLENAQSIAPIAPLGEGQVVVGGSTTPVPLEENPTTMASIQVTSIVDIPVVTEKINEVAETESPILESTKSITAEENIDVTTIIAETVESKTVIPLTTPLTDNVNETVELIPVAVVGGEANIISATTENVVTTTETVPSTFEPEKITIATLIMPKKVENVETSSTVETIPVTSVPSETEVETQQTDKDIPEATTILSTSETSKPLVVIPLEVTENNTTTETSEIITSIQTTELPVTSESTIVVPVETVADGTVSSSTAASEVIITTIETATTELPVTSETSIPLVVVPGDNAEKVQDSSVTTSVQAEATTVATVLVTEIQSDQTTTTQSTGVPPHLKHIVGVVSKTDPSATTDYEYSDADDATTLSAKDAASTTFSPEAIAAAEATIAPEKTIIIVAAESSSSTTISPEAVKTIVLEEAENVNSESTTQVVVEKVTTEIPIVAVTSEVAAETTTKEAVIVAESTFSTTSKPEAETETETTSVAAESTTQVVVDKAETVPIAPIIIVPAEKTDHTFTTPESDITVPTTTKPELVEAVSDLIDIVQGKPKPKE
uniref:Uncharacterized protein n=1 Tax=Panagrolaimus sp. ES5 TaxID=591445 RepID=A0AC34GPQ2_9BILA